MSSKSEAERESGVGRGRLDAELVRQVRGGDAGAFAELHRRHRQRVEGFVTALLRDPAESEDVTQESFLAAYLALDRWEGRSSFSTWLLGIARHHALRRCRRRAGRFVELDSVPEPPSGEVPADRSLEARRVLERFRGAVRDRLSEGQQRILALSVDDCLDTRAIAHRLGQSPGSVKTSLHRSRRTLAVRTRGLDAVLPPGRVSAIAGRPQGVPATPGGR